MRGGLATAIVLGLLAVGDRPSAVPLPYADPQKHVLVLQEFRRDTPLAAAMEDVYRKMLGEALGANLDYYSEFLDTARLDEPDYRQSLLNYLEMRYSHVGLDVLIATTTATLNLIRSADGRMFDGTAVVFHGGAGLSGDALTTGVVSRVDLRRMLEGAIRLQPHRKRIAIVSGAAPFDRGYARLARQQLVNLGPDITLTWLTDLPIATVEQRILALPDDAIVVCLSFTEDATGQRFVTNDIVERLAADARVPLFGVHEVQVGHGVVGGRVFSSSIIAARTAELALRILDGEVPGSISPLEIDPLCHPLRLACTPPLEHFRGQLARRRGRRLPGARILGDVSTLRHRHAERDRSLQTALIAGLLAQRASRRRAQGILHASEAALLASNERARALAGRLIVAQEAERTRLARDLHDDACQQIAGLSVELSRLKNDRAAAVDRELQSTLVRLQQRSAALAENLRLMSHQLHPSVLQQVGLVAALESHRLEVSRVHDVAMDLDITGEVEPLDQGSRLAVFRIAQEAVRNAVVHGRASRVAMSL